MSITSTHLGNGGVCSTQLLKIDGYNNRIRGKGFLSSMCVVDGYKWEIRFSYPYEVDYDDHRIELVLVSLGDGENGVRAAMSCRLVDPSDTVEPSPAKTSAASFRRPSYSSAMVTVMRGKEAHSSGYINDTSTSITVECTITVSKDGITVPSSPSLAEHLGELMESKAGTDVTFVVSGESFAAHKNVLAARSPVFKAEFFGGMVEKSSGQVEIKEMEPSVFAAMLGFLYTDAVPELEDKTMEKMKEASTVALAQRLLVAADRYGLDRLKVMCERRLAFAIDTSTAATTLALAERHGCEKLNAKCVEFIARGSRGNLDAVIEIEGFKDLEANSPSLLVELLVAAHGRKD